VKGEPRSHSASLGSSRCLDGVRVGVRTGVGKVKAVSFVSLQTLSANFFFGEWLLKYLDIVPVYISDNSSLHWLTEQVNTWNRVPLEHMKVCLSKNSLRLWNQKAHINFERACHWTLLWPRLFLYTLSHLISLRWYWRPSTTRSYKRSLLFTLSGKLNQGDWDKHDLYQAWRRW
jgi:hypothetical protein